MASKNLISIIMSVYNGERFIGEAIESCLEQRVKHGWELIVVNDGSTDGTVQIIEKYLEDSRIKLIHQENKGISAAKNNGIVNSSGNYVSFLDADDCYLPHTIQGYQKACANASESIAMFYCNYLQINEHGETTAAIRVKPPMKRPELHVQFLLPNLTPMIPSTTLVRKDALERVGMFDERFVQGQDKHLFSKIVERYDITKLDFFSSKRRIHDGQMIKNRRAMIFWRDERNLDYLKRHDFCYFCSTHDRGQQARLAEHFGDILLNDTAGAQVKSATYLYQLSLSMKFDQRLLLKLERIETKKTTNPESVVSAATDRK
ncbi:MAG: glycosyltransferase [Chlorobiales bacterium]|nr:glycosyltransferase [Chlorobiales bacterium]